LVMTFRNFLIARNSMPSMPKTDGDGGSRQPTIDATSVDPAVHERHYLLQQLASVQDQLRTAKVENNRLDLSNRDAEYRTLELMYSVAALQLEMDQAKIDKLMKDLKMATDPELAKLFELQIALLQRKMAAEEALRKQQYAHSCTRRALEMAYEERAARKTAATSTERTRELDGSVLPSVYSYMLTGA
jgi:DNA polymerase III gamma/tau subunit